MTREELIEELKAAGLPAIATETIKNGVTFEGITLKGTDSGSCYPFLHTKQGSKDVLRAMENKGYSRRDIFLWAHKILTENHILLAAEDLLTRENLENGLRIGLQQVSEEDLIKRPTEFPGIEQYLYLELPQGLFPNMGADGNATVKLHTPMMDILFFSEEELYEIARKNTFAHTKIKTATEVLMGMDPVLAEMAEMVGLPSSDDMFTLYMATNETNHRGASAILDRSALAEYAKERGFSKITVLPSSIHEVLFMASNDQCDLKELSQMVAEINQSDVAPEDVLGNEAFEIDLG